MTSNEPVESQGAYPRGSGELILLVEDQEEVGDMAQAMLEELGYGAGEIAELVDAGVCLVAPPAEPES